MDQIHHIRKLYFEQGYNISEIAEATGRDWKTVAKYIDMADFNEPLPVPASKKPFCPKLEPYKATIDNWLEEDRNHRRKQRHTATRVFDRLTKEVPGFDCSYRLVAEYVKHRKEALNLKRSEGFLPLEHRPGEAQADFGSAEFYERGKLYYGKYIVLTFPWSNAGYLQLLYGENTECLLEGLDAIFTHIGGVPHEIWFDNGSAMVANVIKGGGRDLTERFSRFKEHYGFNAVFMNPNEGHEKGNVENKVGYFRRNYLVPVPKFGDLMFYNLELLEKLDSDQDRPHYYKQVKISELFKADKDALLALPSVSFDKSRIITGLKTDGYGRFTLDNGKHEYSSAPKYALSTVNVRLSSTFVTVLDNEYREIAMHQRLYGDERQSSMDWVPYLEYISRHPRSLKNSGIYEMMPAAMQSYLNNCDHSQKKDVLHILSELTERTGFDSAVQTVEQAIDYEAHDPDSLKSLYNSIFSDVPQLPPLATGGLIPELDPMPVHLEDYDLFLKRGGDLNA
jgi:transposase